MVEQGFLFTGNELLKDTLGEEIQVSNGDDKQELY